MNEPDALLLGFKQGIPMGCNAKTDKTQVSSVLAVPMAKRSVTVGGVSSVLSVRLPMQMRLANLTANLLIRSKAPRIHGGTKT